jgi:hypothetical protein
MKTVFKKGIFLFILFYFSIHTGAWCIDVDTSSVKEHAFDEAQWKKATKDIDYSKEAQPAPPKQFRGFHIPLSAGAAKIILFSIVIAALVFFLLRVLKGNFFTGDKKIKAADEFTVTDPEEDIHSGDLEKMYADALAKGNFRSAIRIRYLIVIRELSLQQMIHWKKEKTNQEYVFEMMNNIFYKHFKEVTLLFEKIWYGETDINEQSFQLINPQFHALVSALRNEVRAKETSTTQSAG